MATSTFSPSNLANLILPAAWLYARECAPSLYLRVLTDNWGRHSWLASKLKGFCWWDPSVRECWVLSRVRLACIAAFLFVAVWHTSCRLVIFTSLRNPSHNLVSRLAYKRFRRNSQFPPSTIETCLPLETRLKWMVETFPQFSETCLNSSKTWSCSDGI